MRVGIDSVVDILELTLVQEEDSVDAKYKYVIVELGEMDVAFATNIEAAIMNKLQIILEEGINYGES